MWRGGSRGGDDEGAVREAAARRRHVRRVQGRVSRSRPIKCHHKPLRFFSATSRPGFTPRLPSDPPPFLRPPPASVFGECHKLSPIPADRKRMWQREMEWLLCASDHVVELAGAWQTGPDGEEREVMVSKQRGDLHISLPALRKLDNLLQVRGWGGWEQRGHSFWSRIEKAPRRRPPPCFFLLEWSTGMRFPIPSLLFSPAADGPGQLCGHRVLVREAGGGYVGGGHAEPGQVVAALRPRATWRPVRGGQTPPGAAERHRVPGAQGSHGHQLPNASGHGHP